MSLSDDFASDVMSGSDTARDTWQDGGRREYRFVSIDRERKHNAVNFKRDFLAHAAEEILRFKVNDLVQARVGGRQEMDGGRKPQEWSIANSKREKNVANSRRTRQEEAHHRPQVKESGQTLERRRAGASSILTRDRESCEEAAVQSRWSIRSLARLRSQSRPSVSMMKELAFRPVGRGKRGRDPTSETTLHPWNKWSDLRRWQQQSRVESRGSIEEEDC